MMQFFGTLEKEEELHTEFKLFLSKEKIIMLCNIKGLKERKKQKKIHIEFSHYLGEARWESSRTYMADLFR